jgi:hypothetical protein
VALAIAVMSSTTAIATNIVAGSVRRATNAPCFPVRFFRGASAIQYRFKLSAIPFRGSEDARVASRSVNAPKMSRRPGANMHEKGPIIGPFSYQHILHHAFALDANG